MADSAEFQKVAQDVRNLDKTPTNEDFATMYALYKQATCGDCNITRPGITDPVGQAKFDAWNERKGMSKEEAAQKYIEKGKEAAVKYGVKS